MASSRSDSFSASERSELDSDSKLMTGSESDGVAARRRLRAASLPTSDAGEGDREGDGDAMAGSRSPPRSSIVAPAGSSSAGVDAGVAPRGANGGGLRHAPVDHAVFHGCRLMIRPPGDLTGWSGNLNFSP